MNQTAGTERASMDRGASERALEEAALRLLDEFGVLAGLNLRAVADEAEVNRGLVYHYFGSRRDLLRSALRRGMRERVGEISEGEGLPFRERMTRFFHTMLRFPRAVRLATLLLLDGDSSLRLMPMRSRTQEVLAKDQREGSIAANIDLEALHASIIASVCGYVLYRNQLAREFGVPVRDLDDRVEEVFARMLTGV